MYHDESSLIADRVTAAFYEQAKMSIKTAAASLTAFRWTGELQGNLFSGQAL